MERSCEIIAMSKDGKRAICIDKQNKASIVAYVNQSPRHLKKWQHIMKLTLGGHKNTELYDKEDINKKCKDVTAMKFFKGQENDRIYCKEQAEEGLYIIVAIALHPKKKTQKPGHKEISIISKIADYEYKIQ